MKPKAASGVFPLLWSDDVQRIVDWAVSTLDVSVAWTAPDEDGRTEHAELLWPGGLISVNAKHPAYSAMGLCQSI